MRRTAAPTSRYWRRRLAALAGVMWLLAALWALPRGVTASGPDGVSMEGRLPMAPAAERAYVVQPGDTLWGVARRLQPEGDVRPLVDLLARSREGQPLQAGERIALP